VGRAVTRPRHGARLADDRRTEGKTMITVDYLGVQGTGKTVKAAKEDAVRKVRDLVAAARAPLVYCYRGNTVIAWQTGDDRGMYTYTTPTTDEGMRHYCATAQGDRYDAMRRGRAHLARTLDDANAADERDRATVQEDIDRSKAFAELYHKHISKGATDSEAHAAACHGVAA